MNSEELKELRKCVFEESEYTWEYFIEELKYQKDLDEDVRNKSLNGMRQLRNIFNDEWMRKTFKPPRHLLYSYLINMAPWSRLWVANFAQQVEFFKSYANFNGIITRLKNSNEFSGALKELEVAWILKTNSFKVNFLKINANPTPDLKTELNGNGVFIEITQLTTAQEQRKADIVFNYFMPLIYNGEVEIRFRIHQILAKRVMEKLKNEMEEAIQEAKTKNKLVEIRKKFEVDFCAVPKDKIGELEEWEKTYNPFGGFSGPPVKVDQIKRIKKKIVDKAEHGQLQKNKPNILVIDIKDVHFLCRSGDYLNLARKITQTVFNYENLVAVVIKGRFLPKKNEVNKKTFRKDNFSLIVHDYYSIEKGAYLIIRNNYSDYDNLTGKTEDLFQ